MKDTDALEMIHRLIAAEVEVVKLINDGGGNVSKAASHREQAAASALFRALTGHKPTEQQVKEMCEY